MCYNRITSRLREVVKSSSVHQLVVISRIIQLSFPRLSVNWAVIRWRFHGGNSSKASKAGRATKVNWTIAGCHGDGTACLWSHIVPVAGLITNTVRMTGYTDWWSLMIRLILPLQRLHGTAQMRCCDISISDIISDDLKFIIKYFYCPWNVFI